MRDKRTGSGRHTLARHGHLRSRNPFAGVLRFVGIAAACVLIAGAGTAAYAAWDLTRAFSENATELTGQDATPPDIDALVGTEGVDLLLTGIDICEWDSHEKFGKRCPTSRERYGEDGRELDAGLNDVNLFVHISPEPRRITAIAFPRDLMIPTPECHDSNGGVSPASDLRQLNEMYRAGGLACVADTINSLTTPYNPDLAIDYAATITWNGVIEITNALGGVEVCVAQRIVDDEAGMLDLDAGPHTLQGEQALAFLRSRHGVGDGSDLGRISNQQVYMSSLVRKLLDEGTLSNPGTVLSLARTVVTNVDPSSKLTPVALMKIALAVKDVAPSDIVFLQYPAAVWAQDTDRVIPIEAEAEAMMRLLATDTPIDPSGKFYEPEGSTEPTPPPVAGGSTPPPTTEPPVADGPEVFGRTAADTGCSQAWHD